MDLRSGAVIAGRYRVDRKVGAGGMGEVWSGDHIAIGSRVALKTMLPAAAVNHEVVARFKREAFLLGKVRSDYVARVVDFVADNHHGLVLVMEFVEGASLARLLTERILNVEETVELGYDLANALTDLHRAHIVHRDLKPGNVILSRTSDGRSRAVLVDFGVSRLLSPTEQDEETITGITRADMAVGTIEYMSPEQILNSRNVTSASDIYAVGAILYRAVSGRHVFGEVQSETELAQLKLTTEGTGLMLPGRNDRLANGLRNVVQRALKRRPSERLKTAEELLAAFTPLRDLVRINALDLDSTTQDVRQNFHEPTTAKPRENLASIPDMGRGSIPDIGRGSIPDMSRGSIPDIGGQAPRPYAPPPQSGPTASTAMALPPTSAMPAASGRRGVPVGLVFGAMLAAIAGGAAGGVLLLPSLRGEAPLLGAAQPTASASAGAATPNGVASASAAPAAASASAEAVANEASAPSDDHVDDAPVVPDGSAEPVAVEAASPAASQHAAPSVWPPKTGLGKGAEPAPGAREAEHHGSNAPASAAGPAPSPAAAGPVGTNAPWPKPSPKPSAPPAPAPRPDAPSPPGDVKF